MAAAATAEQLQEPARRCSPLAVVGLSSRSDEDLLELVAERRDEAAFDELYRRYARPLYAVVRRLVGDHARSEDVVQQAFINVWRAAAGYRRQRGPATGWLFAIARHAAFDTLRSREAASRWEVPDLADDGPGPDQRAAAAEQAFRVHAAVDGLPDHEREVIALAYFDGLSQTRGGGTAGGAAGHDQDPYPPRARPPGRPPRGGAGWGEPRALAGSRSS